MRRRDDEPVAPPAPVALDGVRFERGGSYLVAATEGSVNGCGFSGPRTERPARADEQAFAGDARRRRGPVP